MYVSLLTEYAREAAEKTRELQKSYEARDWKNYAVYVHSLKSTSRMIGATELSEAAAKLEAAADKAQADAIQSGHDGLINLYRSVVDAIRHNMYRVKKANADRFRTGATGARMWRR